MTSGGRRPTVTRVQWLIDDIAASGISRTRAEVELEKVGIPPGVLENPNGLVSLPLAFDFSARIARELSVVEFVQRVAEVSRFESTNPKGQAAVASAITGLDALRAMVRHCRWDDSTLDAAIAFDDDHVIATATYDSLSDHPLHVGSEWQTFLVLVGAGKRLGGSDWMPPKVGLIHYAELADEVRRMFPSASVMAGGQITSVYFQKELVAAAWPPATGDDEGNDAPTTTTVIRDLIRPYMIDRTVSLQDAAELSSLSVRTLQRRLAEEGRSYKDVVQEARHQIACDLLADPTARIIDVAYAVGYANPEHFSRAFRRVTGLSPREYRRGLFNADQS